MQFRSVFIALFIGTSLIVAALLINRARPSHETAQPSAAFVRARLNAAVTPPKKLWWEEGGGAVLEICALASASAEAHLSFEFGAQGAALECNSAPFSSRSSLAPR